MTLTTNDILTRLKCHWADVYILNEITKPHMQQVYSFSVFLAQLSMMILVTPFIILLCIVILK